MQTYTRNQKHQLLVVTTKDDKNNVTVFQLGVALDGHYI